MFKQWVRSLLCTPGIWLNNWFGVCCVLQVYVKTMGLEYAVYVYVQTVVSGSVVNSRYMF